MIQLKTLVLVLIITLLTGNGFSQDDYSIKLGEDGGIGNLKFNVEFKNIPNYYKEIAKVSEDEAEFDYMLPATHWEISSKKAGMKKLYGLEVNSVEVWTYDYEEEKGESHEISSVLIRINIPNSKDELNQFYRAFYKAYSPMIGMITLTSKGQQCVQWLADHNECGILMSLPMNGEFSMDQLEEKGIVELELRLLKGCGG